MNAPRKPSVLFVFYTHTEQSRRVADAMADVLRERGCDVWMAGIEFTDPRYAWKFDRFPFRHAVLDLLAVLPAQVRRSTGQIRIPDAAREGDYDLVCFGSPTWFFTTNMPLRSYLKSAEAGKVLAGKRFAAYVVCRRYWSINLKEVRKLATAQGGVYADGTKFQFAGGQVRSLLSLLSYFGKGEMRERSLGVKIPPTNLKPDFPEQAEAFATKLADSLDGARATTGGMST
jgi:flavodoxin